MVSEMVMASLPVVPPLEVTAVDHQHSTAQGGQPMTWQGRYNFIVDEFLVSVIAKASLQLTFSSSSLGSGSSGQRTGNGLGQLLTLLIFLLCLNERTLVLRNLIDIF